MHASHRVFAAPLMGSCATFAGRNLEFLQTQPQGQMIWRPLFAIALLAPMSSVRQAPRDDGDAIREARRANNAAIARRGYLGMVQAWAKDVSVRAGLGRALTGRQAYREAFVADSAMTYARTPDEIVVSSKWPLAYERGHWTAVPRNSSVSASLSGEYSAQWVKAGGRWLIRSEVFVALWCTGQACDWPASVP